MLFRKISLAGSLFLYLIAASAVHAGQRSDSGGSGAIEGRVVDAATAEPLQGARVTVDNLAATATTGPNGTFRIEPIPAGGWTVHVTYLGRVDSSVPADVAAGSTRTVEVKLSAAYEEVVAVSAGLIRDADARALNQQRTAPSITNVVSSDQIGSFPDRNAAETLQRIPGVSITKDQGEGRYVNIRGTDPRLNSMMINGERIPAPDPLLRQVALDVVPSEILQAIVVSKALTPDMEGDSIGGSVNLITKNAPDQFRAFLSAGGGYNPMLSTYAQHNASGSVGGRLAGGKVGLIFSASSSQTTRGNQDVEVTYTPALGLQELNPRYYQVDRGRRGFTGAMDVKQGSAGALTVRGVFNRFIDDHENRQRVRWAVGNSRIDRELRDRTHIERITSFGVSGDRLLGQNVTLNYELLGAYSDQTDPLTMTTTFRQARVTFAPNVSASSIDPDNVQANPQNESVSSYVFNSQVGATNFSKDADAVAAFNLRAPLASSESGAWFLKAGAKYRNKWKGRTRNESTVASATPLNMTDFLETGFGGLPPYLDGRYDLKPYLSQAAVARISTLPGTTSTRNHQRDSEEFDGTEATTGAYAMAEGYLGPKLMVLPGIRYEYTSADFTGRLVRFDSRGAWAGTDPLPAKGSYGVVLPGVHVRYAPTEETNVRVALTRSLARPNYYDVVPYFAQDDTALTISRGNEDLRPTRSWNVDVMAERYFKTIGVASAGVFYKRLNDYIFSFSNPQAINGSQYQVSQPLNGDVASVAGVEVALQNQLTFLPGALSGIGVYLNYTFTDSSAQLPGHDGTSTLPGQARHVGNVAVSYERSGFSGRLGMTFHGSFLDAVGASTSLDRYYDRNAQLDASVSQKVAANIRLYADVLNMNDALLRYYQGVRERVLQEEHYRWAMTFGAKVNF